MNVYGLHFSHVVDKSLQRFFIVAKSELEFAAVRVPDLVQETAMVLFQNAQEEFLPLRS